MKERSKGAPVGKTTAVTEHVYRIADGDVNMFLIAQPDSVTLVDTAFPGHLPVLAEALTSIGRQLADVKHILLTHKDFDHAGGTAEMKKATGATVWMHPADAAMLRTGATFRSHHSASPGIRNYYFYHVFIKHVPRSLPPAIADKEVEDNQTIPAAGGIVALHTPGHSQGHLAFLWPGDGGVLFPGDTSMRGWAILVPRLGGMGRFLTRRKGSRLDLCPINEDQKQVLEDNRRIMRQKFNVVCFAHGDPIVGAAAAAKFRSTWLSRLS